MAREGSSFLLNKKVNSPLLGSAKRGNTPDDQQRPGKRLKIVQTINMGRESTVTLKKAPRR